MDYDKLLVPFSDDVAKFKAVEDAASRYDPHTTDPTKAVRTASFLSDVREFYRERDGKDLGSDDEALRYFFSDRRWKESNIPSVVGEMATAGSLSRDQQRRLGNLQTVYERFPFFWQEGGRGWAEGFSEHLIAGLADPTNLIPGAAAGKVAFKAARAGLSAPVVRGIGKAAGVDALINAGAAAGADVASQVRDQEIGISDGYKPEQTALSAGVGAGIGAAFGGAVGAIPAVIGARKGAAELAASPIQGPNAPVTPPAAPPGERADQPPMPTLLDRMLVGYREAVTDEADTAGVQLPKPESENVRREAVLQTMAAWPQTRAQMLAKTASLDGPAQVNQRKVISQFDGLYARLMASSTEAEAERIIDSAPDLTPEGQSPQPPVAAPAASEAPPAPGATETPAAAEPTPAATAATAETPPVAATETPVAAETPTTPAEAPASATPAEAATPELSRDDALAALEQAGIDRQEAGARLRQIAEPHKGNRGAEANAARRQSYAKAVEIAKAEAEINRIRKDAYDIALDVLEADKSKSDFDIDQILDLVADDMAEDMAGAWAKYAEVAGRAGEKPDMDKLFRGKVSELTAGIEGQKEARQALDEAIAKEAEAAARSVLPLGKRKPFIDFITKKLQIDLFEDGVASGRPVEQQLRHIKATVWSKADTINLREEELPTADPKRGVQDSGPRADGEDKTLANQVADAPPNALRTGRETVEAPIIDKDLGRVDPVTGETVPAIITGRSLVDVIDPQTGQATFRQPGGVQGAIKGSNRQGFQGRSLHTNRAGELREAGRRGKDQERLEAEAARDLSRVQAEHNAKGKSGALEGEATDAPYKIKLPSFAAAEQRVDLDVKVAVTLTRRELSPNVASGLSENGRVATAAAEDATPVTGVTGEQGSPQLKRRFVMADKGSASYAVPGDEVWLDPKTGKVYKNHPSGSEPVAAAARPERPTPSPEAAAVARAIQSGDKAQAGDLTKKLVAARRKAVGLPAGTTSTTPAAPAPGTLPEGAWVAIRNRENGHTRVLSPGQAVSLNTYDAGTKALAGKTPLDKFDIGHVPAGAKSGYDVSFTPRDSGAPTEAVKPRDPQKITKPVTFESIKDHPIKVGDQTVAAGELHARVAELETRSLADLATAKETIDQLAEILPVLPDVKLPVTTRARAIRHVEYVMRFAGAETIGAVKDILARLGGGGETGPVIRKAGADGHVAVSSNPKHLNTIRLRPQEVAADGPVLTRFMHELAHWSWTNLVPTADKAAFIRYLKNTYFSDQVGLEAFHARVARGTDKSVAELWANQFEAYVAQRFRGGAYSSFWERHTEAASHLIDRMVNPKSNFLDQRMAEDFFAKLLPEEVLERMTDRLAGAKQATTPAGKKLQAVHGRYLMLADDVEVLLSTGDMETLRGVLLEKTNGDGVRTALWGFAKHSKSRDPGLPARAAKLSSELHAWRENRLTMEKAGPQSGDLTAAGIATRDESVDKELAAFGGRAMAVLRDIASDFERAFADVENGAKPAVPETPVRGEAQGRREARRQAKRIKAQAEAETAKVVTEAKAEVAQRPKAQSDTSKPATAAVSPRTATDDELAASMKAAAAGSPERRQAAREVVRRDNAKPVKPAASPSLETESMSTPSLFRALADALDAADPKRTAELYVEMAERGYATPLRVKSSAIQHALSGEARAHDGLAFQDGLAPRGPATLQNVQAMIRAKSPEVEAAARTMLERAWRLLGAATRRDLEGGYLFDLSVLHRLEGTEMPADAVGGVTTVTASSPLRGQVRKAAIALVEGVSSPFAAMHEISHLAMRTLPDETRAYVLDAFTRADDKVKERVLTAYKNFSPQEQAEEWFSDSFAQYLAERVAKGDVWQFNVDSGQFDVQLKTWLERLLDQMKEMVAYITNGLIGHQSMKQVFRQLTWYGDMFAPLRAGREPTAVPAHEALALGRKIANKTSPARRRVIEEYVGSAFEQDRDGPLMLFHATPLSKSSVTADDFVMRASIFGNQGPGIYLSDHPEGAGYGDQITFGAWRNLIADLATNPRGQPISKEETRRLLDSARALVNHERTRVDSHAALASMQHLPEEKPAPRDVQARLNIEAMEDPEAPDMTVGEARYLLRSDVENLNTVIDGARRRLGEYGLRQERSYVSPMYVRATNPLDLRASALHDINDLYSSDSAIGRLVQEMAGDIDDLPGLMRELVDAVAVDLEPGDTGIGGHDLHHGILRVLARIATSARGEEPSAFSLGAMINDAARKAGFDAIAATERRQYLRDDAFNNVDYDAFVLFSPNQVKHAEAKVFDLSDDRLMHAIDTNLAGGLGEHMINDGAPAAVAGAKIMHALDLRGVPGSVGRLVEGILGKKGGASSLATAESLGGLQIRENSSRIRKYVSGWIADKVKPLQGAGHYEQIDEQFAAKAMPIFDALEKLPDGGAWKQGLRETKFWGEMPQSRSEARLMHVLRRWNDPTARNSLSADEAKVADAIMSELRREWTRLTDAGVAVGKIDDFFPQAWKEDAIAANSDAAIAGFARYFYDESMAVPGRTTITPVEARERAERLVQKLADERGVIVPREAYQAAGGKADTLDYQRLIRLEEPWAKEALGMLEPFLEPNLRATLGKYFHTTTARISFVERFGVRGHAVDDYLNARFAGKEVVREILEKGRSMYRMAKVATDNGVDYLRNETPLVGGLGREEAGALTDQLYAIAGSDLANRRQSMIDLIVASHAEKSPHLLRRAEALAQAVVENPGGRAEFEKVATRELQFVEGFIDSVEGKGNSNGPYLAIARRASSAIKAINNVRLLGFTTLTSLSDPAFILGRSGDLKAFGSAMAKAATDPDLRQMMRNVGLGADALVQQQMSYLYGTGPSRFAQAFFRVNGLTSWTGFMREFSGVVGWESIKSAQRRASRNLRPDGTGNLAYRQSKRFLEDLGLHEFVPRPDNASPASLDDRDLLAKNETVRRALLRFANEAVFSPNKNDTPHWVSAVPFADLLWQLKTFPMMAGRHARYLLRELKGGGDGIKGSNPWPALYMLTLGAGLAAGAQSAKDIVQSRGGDEWEGPQAKLRDRSLSKLAKEIGIGDVGLGADADQAIGWYLQSLVALGAFGAMFDIVYNYAQAADNGSFGAQRFAGSLFGPTASGFFDAFNVAGGAFDAVTKESWEPNAKKRTAVRTLVGNVPILGGSRLVREKTTDAIAGEANR